MFPSGTPNDLAKMMQGLGITPDVLKAAGGREFSKQLLNSATSPAAGQRRAGPSDGMSDMFNALEQAKARFQAEKNMSPTPFVPQASARLLMGFEANRDHILSQEKDSCFLAKQTIIGTESHVSRIPLEQLKRTSLREMYVRKTHKGKYLLCRAKTFPVRMFSVHIVVEDVNGDACLLELYNYPGTVGANSKLVEALFPVGSVLAIREPLLKSAAHGGDPLLRVDCPSNVIWLEPGDEKLVGVKWKSGDRVPYTLSLPGTEEEWKKQGNDHYKNGWYIPAAVSYSRGLQRFPSSSVLRLNRAMAYLQLQYHGAALSDCDAALSDESLPSSLRLKAVYRSAQALYGMGHWDEAERGFTDMASEYPQEATTCKSWIQKCKDRRAEAAEGEYDWVAAYKAAQVKGCKMDLADFTGPIKVASLPSRGGGRGIVAKRNIEFGELLVVSKAFVSCSKDDFANPEIFTAINLITNSVDMGYKAVTATKVAERIAGDPPAVRAINQLYAGPTAQPPPPEYTSILSEKTNIPRLLRFEEDVDIERIQGVLSFNSFSIQSLGPGGSVSKDDSNERLGASALFLLPSLFNHSCSPNARWYCLGDVMIIRASCDIPAGDEVFLSYGGDGATYISRAKESCLARLLGSCKCSLCMRDRQAGEAVCKQRDHISNKIPTCSTASAVRSHMKKLDETFKGYPTADRGAMLAANVALSNLYEAGADLDDALRTLFKCLEYGGLKVTDTSLRGALPQGRQQSMPIKLVATGGFGTGPYLPQAVDTCIAIHNAFGGTLHDMVRAAKWLKAAVWLHDKCFGGGQDLFLERYPDLSEREYLS